jgi:hypothetical protein
LLKVLGILYENLCLKFLLHFCKQFGRCRTKSWWTDYNYNFWIKLRYRQCTQQMTYIIPIWLYSRDQVNQACLIIPQGSILWLVIKTLSCIIIRNMVRSSTTLSFRVFSSTTIIEFGSIRRIIWTQFIVPSTNIHSHTHNLWGFTSEHEEASCLSPMDLLALSYKTAKLQNCEVTKLKHTT